MHLMRAAACSVPFWLCGAATAAQPLPVVTVSADDTFISQSCIVRIVPGTIIADVNGDGVLHINQPGITMRFEPGSVLRGGNEGTEPDQYIGIGIAVNGHAGVTIADAHVQGYKIGVRAENTPGLTVERCVFNDLYRQRLKSTPQAEDASDWLWPHKNDSDEWATNYGGAVVVKESDGATLRGIRVRRGQNGILLSRVKHAKVYDNDCSFLSGWGLALWRSCDNIVSRNAFDSCVRGYSHGVYNRGQDSAGILAFEQCSRNLFIENSATHGGDGFFGFAGKEALGEAPATEPGWDYIRRGCNDNEFIGNDFSYAAAHGLELTFSFGNRVHDNRLVGNGICGVWGGYSQKTVLDQNTIQDNGAPGAREGGGVNIEHGYGNIIADNAFARNSVGVALWDDDDGALLNTPWAMANHQGCDDNTIARCRFSGEDTAVRLRRTRRTSVSTNTYAGVRIEIDADTDSARQVTPLNDPKRAFPARPPRDRALGEARPVGARAALRGREKIIMTEWGPWDHESPLVRLASRSPTTHTYEAWHLDGATARLADTTGLALQSTPSPDPSLPARVTVTASSAGFTPYTLTIARGSFTHSATGAFFNAPWTIRFFAITPRRDPRESRADFEHASTSPAVEFRATALDLPFANAGPSELPLVPRAVRRMALPHDRFGTRAECVVRLPEGRYRITTLSDDGVCVLVRTIAADGEPSVRTVIDNWTHHGPTTDRGEFVVARDTDEVTITVHHFELDGYAVLRLDLARVDDHAR